MLDFSFLRSYKKAGENELTTKERGIYGILSHHSFLSMCLRVMKVSFSLMDLLFSIAPQPLIMLVQVGVFPSCFFSIDTCIRILKILPFEPFSLKKRRQPNDNKCTIIYHGMKSFSDYYVAALTLEKSELWYLSSLAVQKKSWSITYYNVWIVLPVSVSRCVRCCLSHRCRRRANWMNSGNENVPLDTRLLARSLARYSIVRSLDTSSTFFSRGYSWSNSD